MAKDRLASCIHYVCKGETCKKGFKDVTLAKCKTCEKYRPRKSGQKQEFSGQIAQIIQHECDHLEGKII